MKWFNKIAVSTEFWFLKVKQNLQLLIIHLSKRERKLCESIYERKAENIYKNHFASRILLRI